MLHLSQLCFALFTLCRTSAEVEILVPAFLRIWNLSGSEANFTDNITKSVSFPNGKVILNAFLQIAYVQFLLHARTLHKRRRMYNLASVRPLQQLPQ
ncbi:hypothetical protein OESDEN_06034 [Oesophagostomum dentatum]|uniref:Secreted protein n=1 Tax=Oesophagostomum dentatum TaxID=61180 RepID=A0A0B1TDZ0_OESDE|nr:hypothetical protein OESDEN_06034 [Oesophagostomum dentatum]